MRTLVLITILAAAQVLGLATASLAEKVVARVDISAQTMTVLYNGWQRYKWPVSTARRGKITPKGAFTPEWMSRYHKSSLYNGAPMPFSIFFKGDYAVHGTDQISRLGEPASAGCVRLHPKNAAILFALTQKVGLDNMVIEIDD